jgi:hypothetical protein
MQIVKLTFLGLLLSINSFGQNNSKLVIGVKKFTSEVNSKYADAVAEKVLEVVTNAKRFTVVDRISLEKVKEELELQKSEAFMDSKNTVKQDALAAANYLILGHVIKMSVYSMKNADGSISGYKASTAFNIKINEVETGKTTEAEDFQTSVSPQMLSPESAVNEALKSVESNLMNYIKKQFPVTTSILKVLATKKESASTVLIMGGVLLGLSEGDLLEVEKVEMLGGKPYPSKIGMIRIVKLAGDDFSECSVSEGGKEILSSLNAGIKVQCKLVTN